MLSLKATRLKYRNYLAWLELKTNLLKFLYQVGRNICHGSDAVESANHEIALWFKPEELCDWTSAQKDWIYE